MSRKCWRNADVDRGCGFRKGHTKWLAATGFRSRPARAKVEELFGEPIFNTTRVVTLRSKCKMLFGFNPGVVTEPVLREHIARLNLQHRLPPDPNLDQVEEVILAHVATINPSKATVA